MEEQQTTHIRVMIADDDETARDELTSLMHIDEDISVVGAGDDAEQAIAIATGASGFLVKGEETPQIVDVIRRCVHEPQAPSRSTDVLPPQLGARSFGNRERRRRLEGMVRGEGIEVVYQPIFDLESGSPVGAEALCRFAVSPVRSSDVWFREAVEQGLGIELEVTAVRQALRGLDQLDPSIPLHVNVSPEACCSPKLRGLLEQVPGDRIVLEITENAPVEDYERLEAALTPLRNRGVGLAVDDTCSGFASLRHVLYLRPDTIKLDLSLTRGVEKDRARLSLVEAIVGFAPSVGAVVLAEGVENHEQLAALRKAGVLVGQGHYLGRPKPMPHSGTWAALGAGRSRQPTTLTPSAKPIEKVTAAAEAPMASMRKPDRTGERPVSRAVSAPTPSRAEPVSSALVITPVLPAMNRNGTSGTNAPRANVTNDEMAAPRGEPSPSSGSMPSSSLAWVSSAVAGSFESSVASEAASSAGTPLRS